MDKFASVLTDDCTLVMNGMYVLSIAYAGKQAMMTNYMAKVGKYSPDNTAGHPVKMIAEDGNAFTRMSIKGDNLYMSAEYHHVVVDGKITEFYVFDDSQKWVMTLKPNKLKLLMDI